MTTSCTAEMQRFSRDRFGSRLLQLTIDQLSTRSLRQFLHQLTGDPVIGQVVIAQHGGIYNVCLMRRSARRAASNVTVHPNEKEAVFAGAFVARLSDMAEVLGRKRAGPAVPLPELHRRWCYLLDVALRRLGAEDAPNACLVRLALGYPVEDELRAAEGA